MSEIRKLSVGGESPKDNIAMHYQVGSYIDREQKYQVVKIQKDRRLFHEKMKSEFDISVINTFTKEVFVWKRVCIGSDKNHFEEYVLDFE